GGATARGAGDAGAGVRGPLRGDEACGVAACAAGGGSPEGRGRSCGGAGPRRRGACCVRGAAWEAGSGTPGRTTLVGSCDRTPSGGPTPAAPASAGEPL